MSTDQIRDIAIKRHDLDAAYFQKVYSGIIDSPKSQVFHYGRNMILEELETLLESVPVGSHILDVGCGTGHLTNWIKRKGYNVYGLEPSEKMYEYAIGNFPDISFEKGISSLLPYNDNCFDLIIAIEVLRYLDNNEHDNTYKEFHRVLKSGGKIFVTHVNLFATDGYYFFYKTISLAKRIRNKSYQFCNFTTPSKQIKTLDKLNFRNIVTIGRMAGAVRILYKFGNVIGKNLGILVKLVSIQRYKKGILKPMAGHLIVIAQK